MKTAHRSVVKNLEHWSEFSALKLDRMLRQLQSLGEKLPSTFSSLGAAVVACQQTTACLQDEVKALYKVKAIAGLLSPSLQLSDDETEKLLALNRRLEGVFSHLQTVVADVTPRLEAKVADPNDPMHGYIIDAQIDYQLREDDPDYCADADNSLARRSEALEGLSKQEENCAASDLQRTGLQAEPHGWLLENLYDYDHGCDAQRVPMRDCLRIGRILVDVQVSQQYEFDSDGELVCDTKRRIEVSSLGKLDPTDET